MIVFYFYRKIILSFLDAIVEAILTGLFFPNLVHMVIMLILTALLLFYVIRYFNKKKWLTITTIIVTGVLILFEIASLILISNADNIYYVYKNIASLVILEVCTFLFYFYSVFFVVMRIKFRNKKTIKNENEKEKEEELEILTFDMEKTDDTDKTNDEDLEILTFD